MIIAQITDLHIGLEPISALNDDRLRHVVARVNALGADLVLATGDLTESGDSESYDRLRAILSDLNAPLWPLVGNHDLRDGFRAAFPDVPTADGFVQYVVETPDLCILVLDTLEEGRHGGAFCEIRASWLADRLAEAPDKPTLIALHHPPVRSGIGWMDAGADGEWAQRLGATLADHPQVVGLICGHLHRPILARFADRPLIVGPSSAPEVGLDLRPIDADRSDRRPLIVEGAPGLALHLWADGRLVSHFDTASEDRVLARFDASMKRVVQDLMTLDPA